MFKTKRSKFFKSLTTIFLLLMVISGLNLIYVDQAQSVTVNATYSSPSGGGSPPPTPPTPPPTPPPPPGDTTPPIVSGLAVSDITSSTARISWTTDEAATSVVNYGTTVVYGATTTIAGLVTSHSITLSGLSLSTLYHFRVRSADAANNEAISSDGTFTTLGPDTTPPTIISLTVTEITGTSAKVNWATNEPTSAKIDYGLTTSYEIGSLTNPSFLLNGNQVITGLNPDTTYHFRLTSTDPSSNATQSLDQTFRTLDTLPPNISNLSASNITPNTATISWLTNELASSELSYQSLGPIQSGVINDAPFRSVHSLPLSNLIADTTYQIIVKATDQAGNITTSAPMQFKTLPDTVPPANVLNLALVAENQKITLSWFNPADNDFDGVKILRKLSGFPSSPTDGTVLFTGIAQNYVDLGLTNDVTYYYGVFAYDTSNNFSSGAIISGTPTGVIQPPPPLPPPIPGEETPPPVLITPPATTVASTTPIKIIEEELIKPSEVRLTLNNVRATLANRTIAVPREQTNEIHSLNASSLGLIITPTATEEIKSMIISLAGNAYILRKNTQNGVFFDGDFVLPSSQGLYPAKILVTYQDGTQELVQFNVVTESFALVFEKKAGVDTALKDVKVSLFVVREAHEELWNALGFNQLNPIITPASGAYGFIVPSGTYVIRASKEGYREFRSAKFGINNFVVARRIELFPLPQTTTEILPFVGNVIAEEVSKFILNPDVQRINDVVAPAITTVVTVNTVAAISILNFGHYLWSLITQPLLLFRRRKYRKWGMVYDSLKRLPIDLAVVRLYQQYINSGETMKRWRLVGTQVTDKQGRYLFLARPGTYHIQVAKLDYRFPSSYLENVNEDKGFTDIYHGETFSLSEEQVLTYNIPLDSKEKPFVAKRAEWQAFVKGMQSGVSFGGVILMGFSYAIAPKALTMALLILNLALYILFLRLAKAKKPKSWGRVTEENTKSPIVGATVRLFDNRFNKLVAMTTTDGAGRYSFLTGPNAYYMIFETPSHERQQTEIFDLAKNEEKVIMRDVKLKRRI